MILYLHGFRSSPQSIKARQLQERMRERGLADRFWCEQLSHEPARAIRSLEAVLADAAPSRPLLVGSSLGGFYAAVLAERHGLRAVLVNPFVPHPGFDPTLFIGTHRNLYTEDVFTFTSAHAAQIASLDVRHPLRPQDLWLLVEEGDEVLDYRHAVRRYAGARQTVLPGGDHGFTRWPDYLDAVIDWSETPA